MDDLFAGVASSIRQAREPLGRSEDDVAREIGLGSAAYEDLEVYDDEVSISISIGQLRRLAKALERPLGQLLSVAREHRGPEVSIDALLERIRIELATRGERRSASVSAGTFRRRSKHPHVHGMIGTWTCYATSLMPSPAIGLPYCSRRAGKQGEPSAFSLFGDG